MFLILNRLRGTIGAYSKVIGLLLALIIEMIYHFPYVTIAVGFGYIFGEALYTWGDAVANLCVWRKDLTKWRIYLAIRGFVWWVVPILSLYFVGFNPLLLLACLIFLSVGFPLACEIGYYTSKKFQFERGIFVMKEAPEHMEVWYGLMQDIVLISLILTKM